MKLLLLSFLAMACSFVYAQAPVSVLTQHNDISRTGWNNRETLLNHSNVTPNIFGLVGKFKVDDQVYAQPLVVSNLTIGNFTGNALFVATVNNTVYAYDANSVNDTAFFLWKANLNPVGQRAPNTNDLTDPINGLPCGGNYTDFTGKFGIVGTPVIDSVSNTMYVVTKTIDSSHNFYAYLNALDIRTGQQKPGSPRLINAQVNGLGLGSVNGTVAYQAKYQNQRPALLLYNNTVYVASASYCDWGPYHGWILGFDATSLLLKYTYNSTANGGLGGIWMAGEGISVGQDGNLYAVTGNGQTDTINTNMSGNRGSSLLKLSPQLNLLDWFTPANYDYINNNDLDYGSDGVLIIPNSTTTVSGSKEGISYIVDYNNMGRFNVTNSQVKDTVEFNPLRTGFVHVHGSPVYARLNGNEYIYGWSESFNLRQFQYDRPTGTFANTFNQGSRTLDVGMPGAMLSLSSNGEDTSTAIVWACYPTSGNANHQTRPGTLAAYSASNVANGELWNSNQKASDSVGNFAKFSSPTIANGKIYVPTFSNAINIYGDTRDTLQCKNNGTGLRAEYFTNSLATDSFPAIATVIRTDSIINFNWGTGSPAANISVDHFKARFTGSVQSNNSGAYTFYVKSDDGVRLWVNNQLLIDKWINQGPTEYSATVNLQRCTKNTIRLEYYENTDGALCTLQWAGPSITKQVIPATQLYTPPPVVTQCISNGTGLRGEYFTNSLATDSFPAVATLIRIDSVVNFNWGSGSPDTSISVNHFKTRFTGLVQSTNPGAYTFYVKSDDGVRLWVNNQLLIDKWINQAPTEYSATVNLQQCTKNTIRLEYYENIDGALCTLQWAGPSITKQVIPVSQLYPPDSQCISNGTGLRGEYFTNSLATDSFPAVATLIRVDSVVNFNWGTGSPAAGISVDHFKARFTGTVQSVSSGAYTFYVKSDDGARLWVNNQLLIDKWVNQGPTEYSATINLQQCTKNTIRLEYFENTDGALCILQWAGPSVAKQVIPVTQLYPPPVVTQCIGNGVGLKGEYFSNSLATDSFPAMATLTRIDSVINFSWGTGSPAANISVDHFKARFTGTVQSVDSGAYTFYVKSDDGARLWINNQLLIDKWVNQGPTEYSTTVNFQKCTKNTIRLEYFENSLGAMCTLQWAGPSITKQVIPVTQLNPPDTPCVINGTGLRGEYFTNSLATDSFPAIATLIRVDSVVNFNWGTGSPAANISVDHFKARFTGSVQSVTPGSYTFYVKSDDGVRLWVNNQLLIDKWINQAPTEYSATVNLPQCTKNTIRLEYYENTDGALCTLQWSGPSITKQVIPTVQLYPPPVVTQCIGNGVGLKGDYFTNSLATDSFPAIPTLTRIDSVVNFNWGTGSPAASISVDHFKARFTGTVQSVDSGAYTFYVKSDDGARLWINNQLLIDKWINQGPTEYSTTVNFQKCTKNTIRLEYFENGLGAMCTLQWAGPLITKQVIPVTQLNPPDTTQPVLPAQLYTEVNRKISSNHFSVYPNPNGTHSMTIVMDAGTQPHGDIMIYNTMGQMLLRKNISGSLPGAPVIIPIILPAGFI